MIQLLQMWNRFSQSAVLWSWAFNALRLASGILLLPLLLAALPTNDLGMYYVFLSLAALAPLADFGFMGAVGRAVSFAMSGVTELKAHGYTEHGQAHREPNATLIWNLLETTRILYALLALVAATLAAAVGTVMVWQRVGETQTPALTWWALALTVVSITWEIYTSWWTTFLYGMNRMTLATRLQTLGYALKLGLSCALLLLGAGLLSVPLAGLIAALVQRTLTRRACLREMAPLPKPEGRGETLKLLAVLWPNSWRQGVLIVSSYLTTNASVLICSVVFGLAANAEYGLTLQIFAIASGMAGVWTNVKWPTVFGLRARSDYSALRSLFWQRAWLQHLTYWIIAVGAIVIGPLALDWLGSNKRLLPMPWLAVAGAMTFLEMRYTLWCTLLTTENRVPSFWAAVLTNLATVALVAGLLTTTSLGVAALIVAPLATGAVFNYWFWPIMGTEEPAFPMVAFRVHTRRLNFAYRGRKRARKNC